MYRVYVLLKLPQLRELDFTSVTQEDRTQIAMLRKFNLVRSR